MNVGPTKATSSVIHESVEPVWNEDFTFIVEDANFKELDVVVKDRNDLVSDELLGRASVTIADVIRAGKIEQSWRLSDGPGELELVLQWTEGASGALLDASTSNNANRDLELDTDADADKGRACCF